MSKMDCLLLRQKIRQRISVILGKELAFNSCLVLKTTKKCFFSLCKFIVHEKILSWDQFLNDEILSDNSVNKEFLVLFRSICIYFLIWKHNFTLIINAFWRFFLPLMCLIGKVQTWLESSALRYFPTPIHFLPGDIFCPKPFFSRKTFPENSADQNQQ